MRSGKVAYAGLFMNYLFRIVFVLIFTILSALIMRRAIGVVKNNCFKAPSNMKQTNG